MRKLPRDNNQILELIGTNAFENFIRELEKEGVGIPTTTHPPKPGREVFPLADRAHLDIAIPQTTPLYERAYTRLAELDPLVLPPLAKEADLDKEIRNRIDRGPRDGGREGQFRRGRVQHRQPAAGGESSLLPDWRGGEARQAARALRGDLFQGAGVRAEAVLRRALNHTGLLDAIAVLFGRVIGQLTVEATPVKLLGEPYKLSDTPEFTWRRMVATAQKTIVNVVACYNPFEAEFAQFLDQCDDIDCFSSLAKWFTRFHVQYLSGTGAVRLYYPNFVAVQKNPNGLVHWIIETKGRELDDIDAKARHMARWCEEVSHETGDTWRYLKVSQTAFLDFIAKGVTRSFQSLLDWKQPQGNFQKGGKWFLRVLRVRKAQPMRPMSIAPRRNRLGRCGRGRNCPDCLSFTKPA